MRGISIFHFSFSLVVYSSYITEKLSNDISVTAVLVAPLSFRAQFDRIFQICIKPALLEWRGFFSSLLFGVELERLLNAR